MEHDHYSSLISDLGETALEFPFKGKTNKQKPKNFGSCESL